MFTQFKNRKKQTPAYTRIFTVVATLMFGLWLNIPAANADSQYAPNAQGSTELLIFDWNKPVEQSHHGFPSNQPPMENGDWTTPVNYAEGRLYFRAEIFSQPEVQNDMMLQFCIWQDDGLSPPQDRFAYETCGSQQNVAGVPGNVVEWSQPIPNMFKLNGAPLDWSRPRFRASAVVKRKYDANNHDPDWGPANSNPPVSDYNTGHGGNYNWAGEDPTEWYPLDMRFSVVVVAKNETFSGWSTYISSGPDTTPPVLLSNSPVDGSSTVAQNANINMNLVDYGSGVDETTLDLKIKTSNTSTTTIPYNDSQITISGPATDMDVSYNPSSDFALNEVVTVTVGVEDIIGNVMPKESFTFTVTQIPDDTPPVISNLQCIASANQFTVEWTTDESATSRVDYGQTTNLELGNKSHSPLKTDHSIVITGLTPQTGYYYKVTSKDANNNEAVSAIDSCITIGPSSLEGDDFNYCELDTNRWSWIDPQAGTAGASTRNDTGTTVEISVPGGFSHDVWDNGINAAHLAQFVNNTDFEFDVKFESEVLEKNQMQGIIIKQDNNNFLRINFRNTDGTQQKHEGYEISGGQALTSNDFQASAGNENDGPMYLRVQRLGDNYTIWTSRDGNFVGGGRTMTTQNSLIVSSIAIFAGNAAPNPAFTAVVDYFFRTDSPISPEDDTAFDVGLTVSPVSMGTISKNLNCGNPLVLNAEPIPGWSFTEWTSLQGSVMTTTNPVEVAFPYNEVITANFEQNFYEVATSVNDGMDGETGGSVNVSEPPTEQGYEYNQLANVTASAEAGWQFDGWTGDVTSADAMLTLVMTKSYSLTANFSQIPYTVSVIVDGDGSVASDPESGPYYLNDSVALTATASAGWSFAGWSGDLTGSDASQALMVDGNKSVMALFTQDQYTLTVGTDGTGTGSVTVSPAQATYIYNDEVELTATADPGSVLTGWSGADLSINDTTATLSIKKPESVVATFAREYYTVTAGAAVGGQISLSSPAQTEGYIYNEVVDVEATTEPGYLFQNWTGALTSVNASEKLTVTGNQTIGAEFVREYYQIDVTHNEGGSVTIAPPASSEGYIYNESVVLTAVPEAGYEFDGWSGSYGDNPTIAATVTENLAIEATFTKIGAKSYVLNYTASEGGTISADPIRDGNAYVEGTTVKLTAVAEDGYDFINWTDDAENVLGLDPASFEVIMNDDKTINANFVKSSYFASTSVIGNGVVNISPLPENEGYSYGTEITLTATPDEGWTFSGWEDADGTTMSTNPLTLSITSDVVYTATFVQVDNTVKDVSFSKDGEGEIEVSPNKAAYENGEEITLTAVATQGWRFIGWETTAPLAAGAKSDLTIVVKAENNLTVKALFERIEESEFETFLPFVY